MSDIYAFDIDGTLLNYGGGDPVVNMPLIESLRARRVWSICLATNQGGIPFAVAQAREGKPVTFPTARDLYLRLAFLVRVLRNAGIFVAATHICVYHPKARAGDIERAAAQVRNVLPVVTVGLWHVYATAAMRKPAGGMLRRIAATGTYCGDSQEDADAATAAGWSFVQVNRFIGVDYEE